MLVYFVAWRCSPFSSACSFIT